MNSDLKRKVMMRVRAVHFMRPFVSTGALCVTLVLVSLYAISQEVWVAQVYANMPSVYDFKAVTAFFTAAFLHTSFFVQVFSIVAFSSVVWLARECALLLSITPQRA